MENATGRLLFKTTRGQERKALFSERNANLPLLKPRVITEEYLSSLRTDLETYVGAVTVPILFIAGARDIIVPLSEIRRLASKARWGVLEVMPDQGHMAPLEVPATIASLTEEFLARNHQT
jgi:pimeloyl-ACP methyl ester carboxylesterase